MHDLYPNRAPHWWERRRCPHVDVEGIYGDEILRTPGGRRLRCRDCGRLLDGPVSIAADRQRLREERRA